MTNVIIDYYDEVYMKLSSEPHVEKEIVELLSFDIPGSKFIAKKNPRFKHWDGKIRLYSPKTKKLYNGLLDKIKQYCTDNNYNLINNIPENDIIYSMDDVNKFVETLKLNHIPRDFQLDGFLDCINSNRRLIVSPTGSGKSLMIYMLSQFYNHGKILIIVPTTNLIEQMAGDFIDYGYVDNIHKIYSGQEKYSNENITISTWQSLINMDKEYFTQFTCTIFDEAHTCKSKSLIQIISNLNKCKYRFAFTGTIQSEVVNILTLEGLFNTHNKVITSAELMDRGQLARLKIDIILLKYSDELRKEYCSTEYEDEISFLIGYDSRNRFLSNLVSSLDGNTLLLFQRVEKHGQILYDLMKDKYENIFFLHGGITGIKRQEIIKSIDKYNNAIIIASYGVLSAGANIPNLNNVIFASPYKSKIKNLQSIGRVLRVTKDKTTAKLYDIADDLSHKKKKNHTLHHLFERVKIYNEENFQYRINEYNIK